MALNSVLVLAAGISTNIGFQDPGFDHQFALPVLEQSQVKTPQPTSSGDQKLAEWTVQGQKATAAEVKEVYTTAQSTAQGPRVSVHFTNARTSEILAWLEKQGISFVVATGVIPADATVTMNIVNQPVGAVANSLATALGGHWVMQDGIRVFRMGPAPFSTAFGAPGVPFTSEIPAVGSTLGRKELEVAGKVRESLVKTDLDKRLAEMAQREIEVYVQGKDGKLEKRTLKPGEAVRVEGGQLSKEQIERIRVEAKAHGKMAEEMVKKHAEAARALVTMNKEQIEKIRVEAQAHAKMAQELAKAHSAEAQAHAKIAQEMAKRHSAEAAKMREMIQREVVVARPGSRAVIAPGVRRDRAVMNEDNMKKLMNSLTPDQKHSMRMRGYVLYIDLTPDQRKLLGTVPKGKFEMKYKLNDQEIVIRGS